MSVWSRTPLAAVLALFVVMVAVGPAWSSSVLPRNVVHLVELADRILVGEVVSVTDGFGAENLPYTEVSVRVDDSIRGRNGSTYTFRQYGLTAPREMPNGLTYYGVSPEGWPRFDAGQEVMLFLYKESVQTGLQTTVGLFQGKFDIQDGKIVNGSQNLGLFQDVSIDASILNAGERRLLDRSAGAFDADSFISLVRRAVDERWVEEGRMAHAK